MKKKLLAVAIAGALAVPIAAFGAFASPFRDRPAFMKKMIGPSEPDTTGPALPVPGHSPRADMAAIGGSYFTKVMTKLVEAREKAKAVYMGTMAGVEARIQAMKMAAKKMDARRRTAAFGHQLVPTGGA